VETARFIVWKQKQRKKRKNILNSLATVVHKNEHMIMHQKVVHPWYI